MSRHSTLGIVKRDPSRYNVTSGDGTVIAVISMEYGNWYIRELSEDGSLRNSPLGSGVRFMSARSALAHVIERVLA